ncbi:hypothetical protein EDB81DRAFT_801856 [Dactylonectria macrodidyma]|uniref:C3H1-type domain-containing protein n=1 Tax=Dactylonectria macrodidyma TaxID=307937 RepID=A0A9P9EEZ8_9HYPO|nr:hypothetical protein EDB81DRAFT_801856 [Dactylonectria macrodidyma]
MAPVEVNVYINYPTLLAQGQKVYAKKKGLEASQVSTWRFDVGQLLEILKTESRLPGDERDYDFRFYLFGSTPPPVDSIWLAMEAHDVQMSRCAGSKSSRRENEVHDKLLKKAAVSHASDACHRRVHCEMIIASGDPDMLPEVEGIRDDRAPVHIWSWKDETPREYLDLQKDDRQVSVHLLDDYIQEIGYSDAQLYVEQSSINPNSIVILDAMPQIAEVQQTLSHLMIRLHTYVYDTERTDAISKDLVVAPAFARKMSYEELEDFYDAVQQKLEPHGLRVLAFWLYRSTYFDDSETGAQLEVSDQFAEIPDEADIPQKGANYDDGLAQIKKHPAISTGDVRYPKKLAPHSMLPCNFRKYCREGLNCPRSHTISEMDYFENNPPLRPRKNRRCYYAFNCKRGAKCPWAHSEAELFCITCDKTGVGHDMDSCPMKDSWL